MMCDLPRMVLACSRPRANFSVGGVLYVGSLMVSDLAGERKSGLGKNFARDPPFGGDCVQKLAGWNADGESPGQVSFSWALSLVGSDPLA